MDDDEIVFVFGSLDVVPLLVNSKLSVVFSIKSVVENVLEVEIVVVDCSFNTKFCQEFG